MSELSHLDGAGRARMVDVADKAVTDRTAIAEGVLTCAAETVTRAVAGDTPKGAVIATAELAGVMAAKRTAELIPLCHALPLSRVEVTVTADPTLPGFRIRSEARTLGRTGVEMEALTAVSVAGLILFDMLKAIDRTMTIGEIRVVEKRGGRSGDWTAGPAT
ncbi:MAG: cyclic pyranopterin monophosphate synthase MoaC [Brevundimonas sp.]|uniref:Cyclic pyranopterin monophosphate synthase n=1 Tax=Brevundimonas albigilva TaxID=1312364 RepID=A0ABY4SJP9_9CAUL|nr:MULTISPECIES: cyclic pyranopterin monophosphate synthase MoaC [Brevundimonas]MCV0416561.1 cyclic pyranopterin monophosphate synthase MoaC [Brevundimonas sp.]URI15008.1 cyclic pyranopterin monophosphate synthase MoaC [Brevundimonas albigilva]